MRLLLNMGNAYDGKRQYKRSFYYTKKLLQTAQKAHAKQYLRDGYRLMSILYDHMGSVDSAYYYYRQYTSMKEYVALDQFSKKLAIYKAVTEDVKKQAQIELLSKEKLIGQQQLQLSVQQLKSESLLKKVLSAGLLVLVILGFIIFRNIMLKRKNETNRHALVENELTLRNLASEKASFEIQLESH